MIAIIGLFIILILALIVIRIGAIALELTGVSPEVAGFQAQSAFSGVGFTTSESETIVNHPIRRKIIRTLILFGSAGITTTIATLIVALINLNSHNLSVNATILAAGLCVFYLFARSKMVYNFMKRAILRALSNMQALNIKDYHELLGIGQGYSISRYVVDKDNWVSGHAIKELGLNKEGTIILSINRRENNHDKVIIPTGDTVIMVNDQLTLYGRGEACQCLSRRPKGTEGEDAHQMRVELQSTLN